MAVVFAVRGDSLDARYSNGGKTGVSMGVGFSVVAEASAIGGSSIQAPANNSPKTVLWPGRYNTPNGRAISILMRLKPAYSGTPAASRPTLPFITSGDGRFGRIEVVHAVTTGNITVTLTNELGTVVLNAGSAGNWNPTAGTWYDVVFTWDGNTTANAVKVYIDGVLLGSQTATGAFSASWANTWFDTITLSGGVVALNMNDTHINEIVLWDSVIDPTNVTLTSGAGSLNGAARTAFVDVAALDGLSYTDPGVGNVKTGTAYTYAGASQTGTYDGSDRWTDPGEANVKTGTAYKANSTTNNKTGTYTGSDRWSDPGVGNVKSGITYKANSTVDNRTGTLVVGGGTTVVSGKPMGGGRGGIGI